MKPFTDRDKRAYLRGYHHAIADVAAVLGQLSLAVGKKHAWQQLARKLPATWPEEVVRAFGRGVDKGMREHLQPRGKRG